MSCPTSPKLLFGNAVMTGQKDSTWIDPMNPLTLAAIQPFIKKSRKAREVALKCYPSPAYPLPSSLRKESILTFSTSHYPLRESFIEMLGLESTKTDLSRLHDTYGGDSGHKNNRKIKKQLLANLLDEEHRRPFQSLFHRFVLEVIAPDVAQAFVGMPTRIRFQIFPCVRVIRPGDFSIGPHADCAYGHHRSSINYYIFLTRTRNGNGLFLESAPSMEDWHEMDSDYGSVWRFHGAECIHWTSANITNETRVSLDFRIIPMVCWSETIKDDERGGNVYMDGPGYYAECKLVQGQWKRCARDDLGKEVPEIDTPDHRVGFPFK